MGSYTNYSLSIQPEYGAEDIIDALRKENESAGYALDECGDTYEGTKWYEHHKDMVKFTKKYPNHIFILEGEGEESGDIWKIYYKNGEYQEARAKIVFDEPKSKFRPSKVQTDAALADGIRIAEVIRQDAIMEEEKKKQEKISKLQEQIDQLKNS